MSLPDVPGPIVEVIFMDSTGHDGWTPNDDLPDLITHLECRAAGYLLNDNPLSVTIGLARGGFDQTLSPMCIPRGAIIDMIVVRGVRDDG